MQTESLQPVPIFVKDRETASSARVVHTALLAQGSSPEAAAPQPVGPSSGCWVLSVIPVQMGQCECWAHPCAVGGECSSAHSHKRHSEC